MANENIIDIEILTKLKVINCLIERMINSIMDNVPYDTKNKVEALKIFKKFADTLNETISDMDDTLFKNALELFE